MPDINKAAEDALEIMTNRIIAALKQFDTPFGWERLGATQLKQQAMESTPEDEARILAEQGPEALARFRLDAIRRLERGNGNTATG